GGSHGPAPCASQREPGARPARRSGNPARRTSRGRQGQPSVTVRVNGVTDFIAIPAEIKPADGRFASGPSKVRPEQVAALAASGATYLGNSHRQAPVRSLVRRVRGGLAQPFPIGRTSWRE